MINKGNLSILFRQFGLMHLVDRTRYLFYKLKNQKKNKLFLKTHSDVKLPPDYLIYESFQLNYTEYYTKSRETAEWLLDYFSKYVDLNNVKILDWGCGPGRVIRHMPGLLNKGAEVYGTDYNLNSINWCRTNLDGISFNHNTLKAELPYNDNFFDVVFGISIFTHLSEKMHYDWFEELYRILKPGGIMFFTTHGDVFLDKLTASEKEKYLKRELVVRGKVKEGHRTFTAYHPKDFMEQMFKKMKILEHVLGKIEGKPQQDIWIVRK